MSMCLYVNVMRCNRENDGKDPVTGEALTEADLLDVKTSPSAPSAPPRGPTFTSIPALLHSLQNEWDASMLEVFELRKQNASLRQELSHALYKQDAATRVLARIMKERDQAREALGNVQQTLGLAPSTNGVQGEDVEMSEAAPAAKGLSGDALQRVKDTAATLSAGRKKRKVGAEYAKPEEFAAFAVKETIPSLHNTKPPGISCLATTKDGQLLLTGGLDKNVQLYDRATGKTLATLKGHTKKITAAHFVDLVQGEEELPNRIVSASEDKTIKIWQTTPAGSKSKSPFVLAHTITTHNDAVSAIAVHPSRSILLSASVDGVWALHDLASEDYPVLLTGSLSSELGGATSAIFHPDGGLFGIGTQTTGSIVVCDTASGDIAHTFQDASAAGAAVSSLSFSENGYLLASTNGSAVHIWDLRKLVLTATIPAAAEDAKTLVVAWDPSAKYLAAAGTAFRLYQNKAFDKPLLVWEENTNDITGVDFAKEGKEIIVAALDRSVKVLSPPAT